MISNLTKNIKVKHYGRKFRQEKMKMQDVEQETINELHELIRSKKKGGSKVMEKKFEEMLGV